MEQALSQWWATCGHWELQAAEPVNRQCKQTVSQPPMGYPDGSQVAHHCFKSNKRTKGNNMFPHFSLADASQWSHVCTPVVSLKWPCSPLLAHCSWTWSLPPTSQVGVPTTGLLSHPHSHSLWPKDCSAVNKYLTLIRPER